jgi:cysteine-rich repeat protein
MVSRLRFGAAVLLCCVAAGVGCGLDLAAASGASDASVVETGSNEAGAGEVCTPGTVRGCYTGSASTAGIGGCKNGSSTCESSGVYGTCTGETLPATEDCATSIDDNCDSQVNEGCTVSCGDGITNGSEACDDDNQTNGDGCDNNCTVSACGNKVTAGTEGCDDGNQNDNDGKCMGGPMDGSACGTGTCAPDVLTPSVAKADFFVANQLSYSMLLKPTSANSHRVLVVAYAAETERSAVEPTLSFNGMKLRQAVKTTASSGNFYLFGGIYYLPLPAAEFAANTSYGFSAVFPTGTTLRGATFHALQLNNVADDTPLDSSSAKNYDSAVSNIADSHSTVTAGSLLVDLVGSGDLAVNRFTTGSMQVEQMELQGLSCQSASATFVPLATGARDYSWSCGTVACNRAVHVLAAFKPHEQPVKCIGCNATCTPY